MPGPNRKQAPMPRMLAREGERITSANAYIKENHSYDNPEITVTEISGGSREYLNWISAETRTDASS